MSTTTMTPPPSVTPAARPASRNSVARKAKPWDYIDRWAKLVEGLRYSPQEFYCRVEAALAERQVPDMSVSRVDWKEGGPLSARREYLRLQRERLVFDVCGAPFGTGFFVSVWCGMRPLKFGLLGWCCLALGIAATVNYFVVLTGSRYRPEGITFGLDQDGVAMTMLAVVVAAAVIVVALVGPDLDQWLIRTPVLGFIYERWFRRFSYYRADMMCMYQQAVHSAVTQVVDEISKAQGIAPLSEHDRRPRAGGFLGEWRHRNGQP